MTAAGGRAREAQTRLASGRGRARLASAGGRVGGMRGGGVPRPLPQGGCAHRDALAIHADDHHAARALRLLRCGAASDLVKGRKVLGRALHEWLGLALGHVRSRGRRDRRYDVITRGRGGLHRHAVPHAMRLLLRRHV